MLFELQVTFTVYDDVNPEQDETFQIRAFVRSGHGIDGDQNTGTITIIANDNAFGTFLFPTVRIVMKATLYISHDIVPKIYQ